MSNLVEYTYWKWDAVLHEEFCTSSLKQLSWEDSQQATIAPENPVLDLEQRRTDVVWQDVMQPLGCIARAYIESANQQAGWFYGLSTQENTQLGRYRSSNQGYYDWHMDSNPPQNGSQRKLTCVILLNDASEFKGGCLQFKGMEEGSVIERRGSIIVFPSFIEHRVTPVTEGVRYTAVTWASGPSFK